MPLREPCGLPKSGNRLVSPLGSATTGRVDALALTRLPGRDDLKGVDHLGVKPRRQLDAHACGEQHEVEVEQVRLLEEPFLVLPRKPSDDRVGLADFGVGGGTDRHSGQSGLVAALACACWVGRGRSGEKGT